MTGASTVDWLRLKTLFAQALEQPRECREAWLAGQRVEPHALLDELRALLAEHERAPDSLLAGDGRPLVGESGAVDDVDLASGTAVGPYRITRVLAAGGMGRVYLAERSDGQFRQCVALKLIRSEFVTAELLARFRREREILARLSHPHIAPLHDGGTTADGVPYFTLEYVEGAPITNWCDERRSTIGARVELMLKVCDAVQYAHRNLVVHRDLKPSNILVTADGAPKLLDFGIAKLLDGEDRPDLTSTRARPMTREYAAPEQVLGEPITTATDVYALGVLLYQLLGGRSPYARAERGEISWPKAVIAEEPQALSAAPQRALGGSDPDIQAIARARDVPPQTLRRLLRGDLERIARRALEKSPEARYPSVSALAADLRSWRDGRALPGGNRRYRVAKFVRRNRVAVTVAASFLVLTLASLAVIAFEARRAAAEAQAALRQSRTTGAVKDFLIDLFRKADPNVAKGREMSARDLLDRGAERISAMPVEQAALRSELQNVLGTVYFQLGLNKEAAALHQRALDALIASDGDVLQIARAERNLATELAPLGQVPKALTLAKDSAARLQAFPEAPPGDLVQSLYTLGWVHTRAGDIEGAMAAASAAIAMARRPGVEERQLAVALDLQGSVYFNRHDSDAAAKSYREALAIDERVLGADDLMTLRDVNGVAAALYAGAHYADAMRQFARSRDGFLRLYGAHDLRTLHAGEGLALSEHDAGLYAAARRDFEQILAVLAEHPPQDAGFPGEVSGNYAALLADLGELDPAETRAAAALDGFSRQLPADAPERIEAIANLGRIHALQSRYETAARELEEAIAAKRVAHDDDISAELAALADVRRGEGDAAAAVAFGRQACASANAVRGERSLQAARAHEALARALLAGGHAADAEAEFRAALASYALLAPPDGMHPLSAGPRIEIAKLAAAGGQAHAAEVARLLAQAVSLREEAFGSGHALTREARAAQALAAK